MTRRRQFRETEVLATLIMQGAILPCKRCRIALTLEDIKTGNVEKEHLHEIELGGADEPFNCAFSHKAKPCHALITHGNGATFAGSSRHRIAKANDPERTEKFVVDKKPLSLPVTVDAGKRCGRCGQYPDECGCPAQQQRSSFGQARRA